MLDQTRGFCVLASAEELIDSPTALAGYAASFQAADDATLLIYAPDRESQEIFPALERGLAAAGVAADATGPDMLLLATPRTPAMEAEIAQRASAVYAQQDVGGAFTALPRFAPADVARLRAAFDARHAPQPPQPPAPRRPMTERDHRQAVKDRSFAGQLDFVHTERCRMLPNRNELLHRIPHHGVAAEIGAASGDYTGEILRRNNPRELHLVDAWSTERYQSGLGQIEESFAADIASSRLRIHQGMSTDVLPTFEDAFFDWVYVDTDHSYDTTWAELRICDAKVKRDGRIAGHDFCTGNVVTPVPYGVVEAVTRFCVEYAWEFEYLTLDSDGHFSFCLKRL